MTKIFSIAGVMMLLALAPANAVDPTGTWLIQDGTARVRIIACGDALCGSVVWLSQPDDPATGQPQTDKLNSDRGLRSRPMMGVPVILAMQPAGEDRKWLGHIYNPDDGNTYRGTIELLDPARLRVRACVAIFCQSEIWARQE